MCRSFASLPVGFVEHAEFALLIRILYVAMTDSGWFRSVVPVIDRLRSGIPVSTSFHPRLLRVEVECRSSCCNVGDVTWRSAYWLSASTRQVPAPVRGLGKPGRDDLEGQGQGRTRSNMRVKVTQGQMSMPSDVKYLGQGQGQMSTIYTN